MGKAGDALGLWNQEEIKSYFYENSIRGNHFFLCSRMVIGVEKESFCWII